MIFKQYHKIKQFKDIIRDIQFKANFKGLNKDKEPIYEETEKPILTFKGTVKLHGTNAGICYTPNKGIVAQKRNSLLDEEKLDSHFGFNQFVQVTQKINLLSIMNSLWLTYCKTGEQITLYGEWAGQGIQKNVGISENKKAFYIFDCKVYNPITDTQHWIDITNYKFLINSVYNIHNFPTYSIDVDFNSPALSQNELINTTNLVEQKCPVSYQLGFNGLGEGIVWTSYWKGEKYIFKVKGEKHSVSKVKILASVSPEILNNIDEFVNYACTENRVKQGIQEVDAKEKKDMPNLLRWVANDIIKEESLELTANNLEWKQVAKDVANKVRRYFFTSLEKL